MHFKKFFKKFLQTFEIKLEYYKETNTNRLIFSSIYFKIKLSCGTLVIF